jgi:hypothetical protein
LGKSLASIALAAIFGASGLPAAAETVVPKEISYEFEVIEDEVAKSCHLLILIVNYPSPEAVNFKVLFTFKKGTHQAFYGFIADAGDMQYRNGIASGFNKVPLVEAEFLSATFNSAGRLSVSTADDGGVFGGTSDLVTASAFLKAVMVGNFAISFRRQGSMASRTYEIHDPPPASEFGKFLECAASYR